LAARSVYGLTPIGERRSFSRSDGHVETFVKRLVGGVNRELSLAIAERTELMRAFRDQLVGGPSTTAGVAVFGR
jgi:hypothetical protein